MRRQLVLLLCCGSLLLGGCSSGSDQPDEPDAKKPASTAGNAADPLTAAASWEVADPALATDPASDLDEDDLRQAAALATYVVQHGTYRTDLLPSQPRRPEEFHYLDAVMTDRCRGDLTRIARTALAPGATQKELDALSTFSFWSLGNDTWHLRSEVKPRAQDMRITYTRAAAEGDKAFVTQRVAAELHFTIEGKDRLVTLEKTIVWTLLPDAGKDTGQAWGRWRLDGWTGRIHYGKPRPDEGNA